MPSTTKQIFGPPADALNALTPAQVAFLQALPKAELHAHLNGCIPLSCLQDLAATFSASSSAQDAVVREGVEILQKGVELKEIHDFFGLFRAIYALTASPENLAYAARAVLRDFLGPSSSAIPRTGTVASENTHKHKRGELPDGRLSGVDAQKEKEAGAQRQCAYLELRSTPKQTAQMTRLQYVETVLAEVEKYAADEAALIVSVDRRMSAAEASECVDLAVTLSAAGRRVVGVDLCGDPLAGDMRLFESHFQRAKAAGLGVTLHIAETERNTAEDTMRLLSFRPDRLGHATFLHDEAKRFVLEHKIAIEICLTSNLLCKTVKSLEDHHMRYHYKLNHPIAICTDDTLPFRNSLLGEYALLLAPPPFGLGMSEADVRLVAEMGMKSRFRVRPRVAPQSING